MPKPQLQGGHRMKLHANAALSLTQRRRMVRLVVEEVVDRGGRGRVQYQSEDVFEVGGPLPGGIRGRAAGSLSARRWSLTAPPSAVEAIAALRRLRFTGPEIAELLDMPLSTVSGILTRIGLGKLGRLGLEPPALRARPARRTDPYRRQEAGPDRRRRRQTHPGAAAALHRRSPTAAAGAGRPAGTSSTSPSTTPRAWPTPKSSLTNRPAPRSGSCAARWRFTPATASPSSA